VGVEGGSGLPDGVCEVPRDRDHRGVGGHVGYLGLGVLEGGEGDVPSNLLLSINLFSPYFLSEHLHGDLLRLGVAVLCVLEDVLDWADCRC
jgi:hypothetical protein